MKRFSLWTWALLAWGVMLVAVAVAVTARGKPGKLYPTFVAAGQHFVDGEPLYGDIPEGQDQFRYSPLAAAAFAPWASLPTPMGAVLWRWLQAVAFLLALRWWGRTCLPGVPWSALALVTLPFVAGNVFNAQVNPIVCALMLAAAAAFSRQRYTIAALAVAGSTALKVYPIAFGLLFCVIEPRRFAPRLLMAVAAVATLPFLMHDPEYVSTQFADWSARVGGDDRTHLPMHLGYPDFQKLLSRWGVDSSLTTYRLIEVMAGATAAVAVWLTGSRREKIERATWLGLIWCTLFGPATESATYLLVAPLIAAAMMSATGWRRWYVGAIVAMFLSMVVAVWFPRPISDPVRALLPQAHGAMLLLGWVWLGKSRSGRIERVSRARVFGAPLGRLIARASRAA